MKQLIREYFTFNKRERNGIFVLLSIIVLLIVYLSIADRFIETEHVDFSKFEEQIAQLNKPVPEMTGHAVLENIPTKHTVSFVHYFAFNPNNLPDNEWKKLGLTEKQIHSIKKYESKGGRFKNKGDVKKMVVISSEQYASLESYICIPGEKAIFPVPEKKKENARTISLELNSADSAQLTTIKGIGPYFAKSIIKYKNALGGFYAKEQLLEVWKFDTEKYNAVQQFIYVDPSQVHKININTCTAEELKHPYIRWNLANAIVNYRMKHGNYATVEEVKKTSLIDEAAFLKMAFYLKVGN